MSGFRAFHANCGTPTLAVAEKMERALLATHTAPKVMILRFKYVPFIDMTGLETLDEILEKYQKNSVQVYLCEANEKVSNKLKNVGILKWVVQQCVFETLDDVLLQIKKA